MLAIINYTIKRRLSYESSKIVLFSSVLALGVFADTYVSDHSTQANQVSQHSSSHKNDSSLGNQYEKHCHRQTGKAQKFMMRRAMI